MDIKVLAAPLDNPEGIDYIEQQLDKQDPFFTCIKINQLIEDGFSEREIFDMVRSIGRGSENSIHIMQPKDNEFFYTDSFIETVYRAWNSLGNIRWYQPSQMLESLPEG